MNAPAGPLAYTAFISYSHAADGALAPILQRALQAFAKPWYRRRAIRVFRDTTGLGATPDLWDAIRDALEASEYFILLASERAAQSRWIELELDAWLRKSSSDRLLIVRTDGELIWNHAGGDFDWQRTTCLHPRLRAQFRAEPLHLDLRWARSSKDLSPRRPEFLDAVARLSATLRQLPVDDLIGEDIRQHRRIRRLAGSAVGALATLLVASVVAAGFAFQQRNAARERLVELTLANGVRAVEARDLSASALWFAEAMRLDARSPREKRLQHIRLGMTLREHPSLLQVWATDASVQRRWVWFGRGGGYVASEGLPRDEAESDVPPERFALWDAQSGQTVPLTPAGGAAEPVLAVDLADRVRVVRATADGQAHLQDARSGAELFRFPHPDQVIAAAFSRNGRLLLTAADRAVRIWDMGDGRLLETLTHASPLNAAGFAATGRHVLSFTVDDAAHVWTLPDSAGAADQVSLAHDAPVEEIDVTPDARFAVTLAERTARLWELLGAKPPELLQSWIGVNHAEFSPDGSRLVMADEFGEATVWRLDRLEQVAVVRHEGFVLHATFSADGKRIATTSTDRVARVWDAESGEPRSPPLYHEDTVSHASFDESGSRLVTATAGGIIRMWGMVQGPAPLPHEQVERAQFHPQGKGLLTVGPFEVKRWDSAGRARFTLTVGSQIYDAAFSPDGRRIVTASEDGRARIWDADTGAEMLSLAHERRVNHASFRPDGLRLATAGAAGHSNAEVALWDLATGARLFSLPHPNERPDYAEFSPDGKRLVTLGVGVVHVWDLARREKLPGFDADDVRSVAFSPDGKLIVLRHGLGAATVYDVATGSPVGAPIRHENYMLSQASFAADAMKLVVVGGGYARIWNSRDGSAMTPPLRHPGADVRHAEVSPDADLAVTIASDGSARLWDARTGQLLTPPLVHGPDVAHAAFSPDGLRIVTCGSDAARMWDVAAHSAEDDRRLSQAARVLAARQLDATGAVVPLTTMQFRAAWEQLQGLAGEPSTTH